uniref:ADP ribosyltransferase domain-containing protein n=1 Tax=uncultured Candidatus Melainabacteria bacterium TaxID=2682970 RepID=A0A650EJ66_9BACT|nr:hypothetical protein Melaina855_0500 [uncultured Candidatus Melainabacteria bacterium]
MSVYLKLLPELYTGVKSGSKYLAQKTRSVFTSVKPETLRYKTPTQLQDEIRAAYREYSRSAYINDYLREGKVLSQRDKQQVWALKAAINTSEPITGTFIRGLSPKRNMPINPDTIEKFIFKNAGFTSTAPLENANFANSFASMGGATVKFEITKPMQAYKASNYEVLFNTNAFTPDKFKIIHEGDNVYRVVQK